MSAAPHEAPPHVQPEMLEKIITMEMLKCLHHTKLDATKMDHNPKPFNDGTKRTQFSLGLCFCLRGAF